MIRRKLTRIEVTLDDTKELDDFFSKTPQIGLLSNTTCSTTTNSKLTNLFYQRQLLLLGKKYDFNQAVVDSSLDPTCSFASNRIGSVPTNSNATIESTSTVVANSGTIADTQTTAATIPGDNFNESEERLVYNPQPFNPTSRFNQDSQ